MSAPVLAAVALAGAALILPGQVAAQAIDFGRDTSPWANDGECDDPRFEGPGMTQTPLLDSDIRADATDCMTAYAEGRITLVPTVQNPVQPPGGGKTPPAPPPPPPPQPTANPGFPDFGDDSGEWAYDGECDDRRFVGTGMARVLSWRNVGKDASDCRRLFDAGRIRLWDMTAAITATQCALIDFGNDSGDYPADGECDDSRFEGPGAAGVLGQDQVGRDATDCRQMCTYGVVALRNY
jgi:hypothetical protein